MAAVSFILFPLRSLLLHILLLHSSLLRGKAKVVFDALYEAIRCTKGEICMWMTSCIVCRGEGGLVLAVDAESQPLDDRLIGVDVLLIDGCAKEGLLFTAEGAVVVPTPIHIPTRDCEEGRVLFLHT